MTERDIAIRLRAINELAPGLGRAENMIGLFAGRSKGKLKGLALAGTAALAAVSAAMIAMGKRAYDLDKGVLKVKQTTGLTSAEMLGLKEQMIDTAIKTGTNSDQMIEMSGAAIRSSKNLQFVRQNVEFLGRVMSATGGSAEELGEGLGASFKEAGVGAKDFQDMISRLYSIGKQAGAEKTLLQILPDMPTLIRNFKVLHPKASFKELNDYLALNMFSQDPRAVDKAMRKMFTNAKIDYKLMNKVLGTKFKTGEKMDMVSVIDAIIRRTPDVNKQLQAMQMIFGKNAIEVKALYDNYELYRQAAANSDVNAIQKDSAENAKTLTAEFNALKATFDAISVMTMGPFLKEINKALGEIDPATLKALADEFMAFGKVLGMVLNNLINLPARLEDVGAAMSQAVNKTENLKAQREYWGYGPMEVTGPGTTPATKHVQSGGMGFEVGGTPMSLPGSGSSTKVEVHNYINGKEIPSERTVTKTGKTGRQATVTAGAQ